MWARIAEWFGIEPAPFDGTVEPARAADGRRRRRSGARSPQRDGLAEPDLDRLASPWHTDADLGRPIEVVTDMTKSRRLGFIDYQATDDSFFDLFARLRATVPERHPVTRLHALTELSAHVVVPESSASSLRTASPSLSSSRWTLLGALVGEDLLAAALKSRRAPARRSTSGLVFDSRQRRCAMSVSM